MIQEVRSVKSEDGYLPRNAHKKALITIYQIKDFLISEVLRLIANNRDVIMNMVLF
ncbi:MAG: hypothetical protein ACI88H_002848 [Cocleimonas sp.]|jgi:hypothetical protein